MMPGNPIEGGTVLRRPAIQSPNFVHGVSGWTINADGSAEFNSITVPPGTSGNTIFTQPTAPTAHAAGDLWINTSASNEVSVWNGSAWTPYQWGTSAIASGSITAALIAANTITAGQLAAGIVYAGIVNGTTITGAQIIADGTSGQLLAYTGTPALNNLIAAISGADGTDTPGNKYYKGVGAYGTSTGQAAYLTIDSVGQPWLVFRTGRTGELTLANIQRLVVNSGAANESYVLNISPGTATGQTDFPYMELSTNSLDGTSIALGILAYKSVGTVAYWYVDGFHITKKLFGASGSIAVGDNIALDAGKIISNDTWHTITLDSGWSVPTGAYAAPRYRILPDGNLQLNGRASATAWSGGKKLNSSNPLTGAYVPLVTTDFVYSDSVGNRAHCSIGGQSDTSPGVITASLPSGASGTWFAEINGIVPLN